MAYNCLLGLLRSAKTIVDLVAVPRSTSEYGIMCNLYDSACIVKNHFCFTYDSARVMKTGAREVWKNAEFENRVSYCKTHGFCKSERFAYTKPSGAIKMD